jgi:sugar lactone lactonase YvrE
LFVTNVLNGTVAANGQVVNTATVLRISLDVPFQGHGRPHRTATTVIGSGFSARTDTAALVIGPTGVGLGRDGTLYVADTLHNRIAAISHALKRHTSAGTGKTVSEGGALNGPLGLTIAPNGAILTVNSNDGFIVETTPRGKQINQVLLDNTGAPPPPGGAGCLFGLALIPRDAGVYFVDDCDNTLKTLT